MANTGDLIEVVLHGRWSGLTQTTENVFHYRVESGSANIDGVGSASWLADVNSTGDWMYSLLQALYTGYAFTGMTTTNLTTGVEFWEYAFPSPVYGQLAGDPSPTFLAVGYIFKRSSKLTRNGQKRFSGFVETSFSGNGIVSDAVGTFNAVAIALMNTLTWTDQSSDSMELRPIILRKPPTGTPTVYQYPSSCQLKGVTTQNSRKK